MLRDWGRYRRSHALRRISGQNKEWYGVDDLLAKIEKRCRPGGGTRETGHAALLLSSVWGFSRTTITLLFDENYDSHFFFEV